MRIALTLTAILLFAGCASNPNHLAASDDNAHIAADAAAAKTETMPIGVIDLQKLADLTGYNDHMQEQRAKDQGEAKAQLELLQQTFTKQLEDKRDAIAAKVGMDAATTKDFKASGNPTEWVDKFKLSKEQAGELQTMYMQASQFMSDANQKYVAVIQQRQQLMAESFLKHMRPFAAVVATKKGVQVIFQPGTVIYFDPKVDLTTDMHAELANNKPPVPELPELPKIQLTGVNLGAPTTQPGEPLSLPRRGSGL